MLEQIQQAQLHAEGLADLGNQLRPQQRVPAAEEEIIVHSHPLHMQQRSDDPGYLFFHDVAWLHVAVVRSTLPLSGSGNADQSTFPLLVTGNDLMRTKVDGIM